MVGASDLECPPLLTPGNVPRPCSARISLDGCVGWGWVGTWVGGRARVGRARPCLQLRLSKESATNILQETPSGFLLIEAPRIIRNVDKADQKIL